jgi:uncharacterized protein YfbU (UPF0304 family)
MQPTATEQLILHMLCDVYKKLGITDSFNPDLIASAVSSDDCWVLNWAYDIKDAGDTNPAHVTTVVNALDMYNFLKDSFQRLGAPEKAVVEAAIPRAEIAVEFPGFDGNNEGEYRTAARFLVNDLDRFNSMKGVADRNSHTRMAGTYTRQYEVFEPIRATLIGQTMSEDQIIAVLQA